MYYPTKLLRRFVSLSRMDGRIRESQRTKWDSALLRRYVPWGMGVLAWMLAVPAPYAQRLTLTPSLSVGERYDSNIFQDPSGEIDDFITLVSPGISVDYISTEPTPETKLEFDYRADFEFFADRSDQDQIAHFGFVQFSSQLTRTLTLRVLDRLIITEDPLEREEVRDQNTGLGPASQQTRERTVVNRGDIALDVLLGQRFGLGMLFNSYIADVSDPDDVDEFRYSLGADLGYFTDVRRGSRATLSYLVTLHNFHSNGGIVREDFVVHNAIAGFRHLFTPTLSGRVALGYAIVVSDDPEEDGRDAILAALEIKKTFSTGEASFLYNRRITSGEDEGGTVLEDTLSVALLTRLGGKTTARLRSDLSFFDFQRVDPSTEGDRWFWSVRPTLSYQISRPWGASLGYIYEYTNYTQGDFQNRSDHRLVLATQLSMREWLFFELSYRFSARHVGEGDPVSDATDFDRHQVMLTVTARPAFRF